MLVPAAMHLKQPRFAKEPFYTGLPFKFCRVGVAIILATSAFTAIAMKPSATPHPLDKPMIITLVIFCTLVTGIARHEDMKKVGRVGGSSSILRSSLHHCIAHGTHRG